MMKRLLAIVCLLLASSPIFAGINNPGSGSGGSGSSGSAQINIGSADLIPANFINVFKVSSLNLTNPLDATVLDDDGYLVGSPISTIGIAFPSPGTMFTNVTYKLRWDAGVQFSSLVSSAVLTSCANAVNVTVTGCAGASTTFASTGGAGSVTFTTAVTQFSFFWGPAGTYTHTAGSAMSLYRLSDETDFLAGEIFTPEFKTVLRGLNPKTIRAMGWTYHGGQGGNNSETTWNYRFKPTTFTWNGSRYPPAAVAPSAITGTDTYAGAAASGTPGSWTDGETYVATWTNANTSTTPTLNINSRGAKTITDVYGSPLVAGAIHANSLGTVVYDAVLNILYYTAGGVQSSIPIEAQANIANKVSANLWATLPQMATDNYVTNWAATACGALNGSLYFYPEWSNEVWNSQFPQTSYATQRGDAFGWVTGSGQDVYGYYGLRVRQVMGNLIPGACGSHPLRRVMAYQGASDTTNITNRFEGAQLRSCSVFGAPCGNTTYDAFSGTANYSTLPNRPIDVTEVLAYAPYAGGTNLCLGTDIGCTPTANNAPFYQALVTAWEGGQSATSISMVDTDIRTGLDLEQSVTASGTTFTTPLAHGFVANTTTVAFHVTGGTAYSGIVINTPYRVTSTPTSTTFTMQPYVGNAPSGANVNAGSAGSGSVTVGASNARNLTFLAGTFYQFGETNAALFDGNRPSGMANLRVEQYEGNLEPLGPTAGQCTSLGITGTNCTASIAAAILAWKNDPAASATTQAYYNQFMGADASMPSTFGLMLHSKTPAWLVLPNSCGGSPQGLYPMLSDCLPNSTPFQMYNGFAAFHGVP